MKNCLSGGGSGARVALGEPVGLVRQPECNTPVKTPAQALHKVVCRARVCLAVGL